ncbi:MAG TPA: NUDIX hydrolase [Kribbellaceae bacterium]|nr:NUDIX hydrolase [Kribbellaceae bacterium]
MTALHADATRSLNRWAAPDDEQERLRTHYLRHLGTYDDGLSRERLPEHVTASALVLDPDGGRVLLNLHTKVGRWLQFGGHCEPADETLAGAALRETREESGLDVLDLDPVPVQLSRHQVRCGGGPSYHLDVQYVAVPTGDAEAVCSSESDELRWFGVDELPSDADHAVVSLVRRSVRRLAVLS